MIRRRRRTDNSGSGSKIAIEDLPVSECNALVIYLYRILQHYNGLSRTESLGEIFFALVKKYGKQERLKNILKLFINRLVEQNSLTTLESTEKYNHPYDFGEKLSENFNEDADIAEEFETWASYSELRINTIRAIWNGGKYQELGKILAMTIFTDKEFDEIPGKVNIPARFLKAAENTAPVQFLVDALKLSKAEAKVVLFGYRTMVNSEFSGYLSDENPNIYRVTADCIQEEASTVRRVMRSGGKLADFGFFDNDGEMNPDAIETIQQKNINSYFSDLVKELDTSSAYEIDSFSVNEKDTQIAMNFLNKDSFSVAKAGMNILLYGKPGSGKTEYAKALAKKSGKKCFIFKNETEVARKGDDGYINVLGRLNCFLSLKNEDSIVIVDEAECILKTRSQSFFGEAVSTSQKGTINRMLENTNNKVIWILNYTSSCDESTLRRFTYAVHFDEMPSSTLQKIADTKLSQLDLNDSLHEKLLDLCGKYRVSGASVENMLKTIESMPKTALESEKTVISDVKAVLESNSTLIHGKAKMREKVSDSYDLSILNTTTSAEKIVKMIENAVKFAEENGAGRNNGIRMLFYGMSGTGKTEFARYIAETLGKRILLKRASDIFGKYVGENEKNIKAAFEEAESSGSILLFDEADSFFADRNSAEKSWERTTVNEFLTQMEEFNGILICTTNLRKIMDSAMQRRFHILSEFMPLERNGIELLLKKYFTSYTFSDELVSRIVRYNSVTPGDFGQLYGKVRFMDKDEISAELIIDELISIQEEKDGASNTIGFCA